MPLTFEREIIDKVQQVLLRAKNIVLVSHTNADGDAVGSILGMYHLLKNNMRGDQHYTMILPNGCPFTFDFLPGASLILNADSDRERCVSSFDRADLIIGVDFNDASRIGSMADALREASAAKLLIDHHINPDTTLFHTVVSQPQISATCELLYWLGIALWGPEMLNHDAAMCLYNGIMTDTGSFAFSNNHPSVYEAAAHLVKYDINAPDIHNKVMNSWSVNKMQFLGYCLDQRMHIFEEEGFAYIVISKNDMQRFNIQQPEVEGLVNYVMMLQKVEVGALVKEYEPMAIRISFRSKSDFNVQELARNYYGGGGHRKASGATSNKDLDTTVQEMEAILRKELAAFHQTQNR